MAQGKFGLSILLKVWGSPVGFLRSTFFRSQLFSLLEALPRLLQSFLPYYTCAIRWSLCYFTRPFIWKVNSREQSIASTMVSKQWYGQQPNMGRGWPMQHSGGVSPFVMHQRWEQDQWQRQIQDQGMMEYSGQTQFPGFKSGMMPGTCPPWVCTNTECKARNDTGKPKPKETSPTKYCCYLCAEPRPVSTTLWALPIFGGPGIKVQLRREKKARNRKTKAEPSAEEVQEEPQANALTPPEAPHKGKGKGKGNKSTGPKSFAMTRETAGILMEVGVLEKEVAKEAQEEMIDDSISTAAFDELTATTQRLGNIIASMGNGATHNKLRSTAEALLQQCQATGNPAAPKAEQDKHVDAKPQKSSMLAHKKAVLQEEVAKLLKKQEEVKATRDNQLKQKAEAIAKLQAEQTECASCYQTELDTCKQMLDSLEQGISKVDQHIRKVRAPATPLLDNDQAGGSITPPARQPRARWKNSAVAPLTTLKCEAGYHAFCLMGTQMQQQTTHEGAQSIFFQFLAGLEAKASDEDGAAAGEPVAKRVRAPLARRRPFGKFLNRTRMRRANALNEGHDYSDNESHQFSEYDIDDTIISPLAMSASGSDI